MKKRVFFAIDLPEEVKKQFGQFFKNVGQIREVKWEKPEKLHFTLIFLGFVDEKKIPQLTLLLNSINVERQPLSVTIIPILSAFPTMSNPRVLWLPIEGNATILGAVAKKLSKKLKEKKFVFDKRKFSAHLTLGRLRDRVKKEEKEHVIEVVEKALPKGPIEFAVNGLTLFESKLSPKGSVYNILANENFGY